MNADKPIQILSRVHQKQNEGDLHDVFIRYKKGEKFGIKHMELTKGFNKVGELKAKIEKTKEGTKTK
tara:strand:- start:1001 stop:1201 length:201 start_codon:yes stop_codon:yes gene_type:complete